MKRFYEQVALQKTADGYGLLLDGRALKTPMKTTLMVPGKSLAEAIQAEWQAVEDEIAPMAMPMTALAFTCIDRVMTQRDELVRQMVQYAGNDLICYREDGDQLLAEKQNQSWNRWTEWAASELGMKFQMTAGIMPIDQPDGVAEKAAEQMADLSDWHLTLLVRLASLGGSFTLAMAFIKGAMDAQEFYQLSHLDELYQMEKWGADAEAQERLDGIMSEYEACGQFLGLLLGD